MSTLDLRVWKPVVDTPRTSYADLPNRKVPCEALLIDFPCDIPEVADIPCRYFNRNLLTPAGVANYGRKARYYQNHYLVSIPSASIIGCSTVFKDGWLYPEGFRAAIFHNVSATGTSPVGDEPLRPGAEPFHYVVTLPDAPPRRLTGPCLLLKNTHSNAWAFWQMDISVKINYWLELGRPESWSFIVDSETPEYQIEILEFLGVKRERLIFHRTGEPLLVEHLLLASPLAVWGGGFSKQYSQFWFSVCDQIAAIHKIDTKQLSKQRQGKILYISRSDVAAHRPIVNVSEIEAELLNRGADFIVPGILSLKEKVEGFFGYSVIVGALGSGTNNVIFGGGGGDFLGLWPHYLNDSYIVELCQSLQRRPNLLFCDGFVSPAQSARMQYKSPFLVDPEALEYCLNILQS